MQKLLFTTSVVVFLFSCTTSKNVAVSQADADRGATKFSGYTLAQLNQGRLIYEGNCGSCHTLHKPASQSEEQWSNIVPKMVKKVNKKAGSEVMNAQQQELVFRYLVTMGSKPNN